MLKFTHQQLTLPVGLREDLTFDNFYAGNNQQAINVLRQMAAGTGEKVCYLWGTVGVGRSHLLQASCHYAGEQGFMASYLPLKNFKHFSANVLDGLENLALVCIDDVDAIAGLSHWEEGLFHLYNRSLSQPVRLIFAASAKPQAINLRLADLVSRLTAGLIFHLEDLADEEKNQALQLRAKQRGLELSEEIGQFLLKRCPRDIQELFKILDQLDQASLAEQRKLSIPFIKSVLQI